MPSVLESREPLPVARPLVVPAGRPHSGVDQLPLHALAQLPDRITLCFPEEDFDRAGIELLARAYGIESRVAFAPEGTRAESSPGLDGIGRAATTLAEVVESLVQPDDPPASLRFHDELFLGERIAIVTNLPTHYRVPLFNAMHRRLEDAGAALRVFFLADLPHDRTWMQPTAMAFDHEFLESVDVGRLPGRHLIPRGLPSRLERFSPTLVLAAGFSPAAMRAAAYSSARKNTAFGVWSGEIPGRSTAKGALRTMQRRWLARRASFAVAYGWESARYLNTLRPDLPVVIGRNTAPAPRGNDHRVRGGRVELLTVGRAERGKALDVLVRAMLELTDLPCRLTVIGDGRELRSLSAGCGPANRIRFLGALPSGRVLQAYADADVFLFPSRVELFGLALVEAMGAGLPVVVSRATGAVADLCVPGVNAVVVEDASVKSWARAIREVVEDVDLRRSLGRRARQSIAARWTIEHGADAMLAGLRLGAVTRREETPP